MRLMRRIMATRARQQNRTTCSATSGQVRATTVGGPEVENQASGRDASDSLLLHPSSQRPTCTPSQPAYRLENADPVLILRVKAKKMMRIRNTAVPTVKAGAMDGVAGGRGRASADVPNAGKKQDKQRGHAGGAIMAR